MTADGFCVKFVVVMKAAHRIIEKFGGVTALSRALGHGNRTTVQGWHERGNIPNWRHAEIVKAAREAGIEITKADFVDDFESADEEAA